MELRLESSTDSLDLASYENQGWGYQVTTVSGLGLPPVNTWWIDGAGDGSRYRGRRILARDMDYEFYVEGRDHDEFKALLSRLARVLSDQARMIYVDGRDNEWYQDLVRVGGGDWALGAGSETWGDTALKTVVTMRSGDPFFTSTRQQTQTIGGAAPVGLLSSGSLVELKLTSAQSVGAVVLANEGDAEAYPVWTITGPCTSFTATRDDGATFTWTGSLTSGQTLTIDTRKGTAKDSTGANRYDGFATRPRLWTVPDGSTTADLALAGSDSNSKIQCTWSARRWVTI